MGKKGMRIKLCIGSIILLFGLFANAQTYVPHQWGAVAMGGGGFVSAVITSPTEKNLIYARTDVGGAYRWVEATKSWKPLNNKTSQDDVGLLGIESLAIDPQLPNRLYMVAGISYFSGGKTAILRSDDYGNSFNTIDVTDIFKANGNGAGRQNGERLMVDPHNSNILLCGTRSNGLFKSVDAGITWSRVASLNITTTNNKNGICAVVFDKNSGKIGDATKTIYVGVSRMGQENLYVSHDAGETWDAVSGQPTTYMPQRLVLNNDGNLYIPYANGAGPGGTTAEPMNKGALWKYNTVSKAWTNITPAGLSQGMGSVSIDASNPNKIITSTVSTWWKQPWGGDGDFFYISEDGGSSWTSMYGTKNVNMDSNGIGWIRGHAVHWVGSVEIDPFNPNRFFMTSGNGLFGSENMNARPMTLKFMAHGIELTVPFDIYNAEGNKLLSVIGDFDGFVHEDVHSFPLSNHKPGLGSTYGLATAPAARNIAVRASKGMYYTDNSGTSWTKITDPVPAKGGEVCLTADGGCILWCVDDGTTTYFTKNKGTNWTASTGINFACAPAADYVNANKVYAYNPSDGFVYVSSDAGASFTKGGMAATTGSRTLRTVPGMEGNVWVAAGAKGLWKSTNSATSFSQVSGVSQCDAVGFGKAAPGKTHPVVFIWGRANGGAKGLYRSIDGGANWQRINDEQHQFGGPGNGGMVKGDLEIYGRVYMTTAGLGMIYGDVITETACEYPNLGGDKYICEAYDVTLDAKITQAGYSFAWSKGAATLAGTSSTISVVETGIYRVDVKKSGCPDVFDYVQVKTKLIPATNDTVCPNEEATISVSGTGTYAWYDAPTNGTNLANGNTFSLTPTATKTYYVQDNAIKEYSLGLPALVKQEWSLGGGFADNQNRIRISVLSPLWVKSIAMNVAGAGKGVIRITNDAGTLLTSGTVASMPTGLQAIPINYQLPVGTYYIDAVGTNASVSFQSSTTGAKWSIPEYVTLTQLSGWGAYGIFFDIQFEVRNTCLRTPVEAVVKTCNPILTQTIALQKGWNLISTNVHPADSTVATLFNGLDVREIKTMDGFWRKGQDDAFNSLKSITAGEGYLVYMNVSGSLTVSGTQNLQGFKNLEGLNAGWQLIGCPYQTAEPMAGIFGSKFSEVKNFDGFWMPNGTANSIENLEPGKGYFAKY
jgi:xyloglucan-specific exo-beta-1,4-glucanase